MSRENLGEESDRPSDDLGTFANMLNRLKTGGCTLLVVGEVSREMFTLASKRMLGAAEAGRYRVVGLVDVEESTVPARLPDPDDVPRPLTKTTHLVTLATRRSVTDATDLDTSMDLTDIPESQVCPDLTKFEDAMRDAISTLQTNVPRPTPADIRVCIDSLDPLLCHYDHSEVRRCLQRVTARIDEVNGMGHFVLPRPYDSAVVDQFSDIVNAVVELQYVYPERDHDVKQRWHVASRDDPTEWMSL